MPADGPNAIYRFTLTSADALAWETLPREMSNTQKLVFVVTLVAAGGGLALVPERWTEGVLYWVWLVWVALAAYTVSTVMNRSAQRARAIARFPRPTDVVIEAWDNALSVREGRDERHIGFGTILAVTRGKEHLFLPVDGEPPVIIPNRALDRASRDSLAARIILAIRHADGD